MIRVDLSSCNSFIPLPYEAALAPRLRIAHDHLQKGDGAGSDFTGWVRLPENYDRDEFARIKAAAARIKADSQALVVIGIGGSYLGARGVIECLRSPNYNLKRKDTPNIYFVGNGLSSDYMSEIVELLDGVDFSVNVISKSGTTTEPAVAFRFFRELLEKKYGPEGAAKRIYATTDRHRGALKSLADAKGYETFVVPDDVGGPCFRFMAEWWKQLYGESEGKEGKGLFPASVEFTADLHSMGQYIQQGERHLFETVVRFGPSKHENPVPYDETDGDGLNFLTGRSMDFIREQAMDGTLLAHVEGGVPNITLYTGALDEGVMGQLIYFFEYACGLSGYLLDVNPFDQPGVEAYKKNMFALLGKPGYEELRGTLLAKLGR